MDSPSQRKLARTPAAQLCVKWYFPHETAQTRKFLSVPSGTSLNKVQWPDSLDKDLQKVTRFKVRLDTQKSKDRIALDVAAVEAAIEKDGFAVHGAKVFIEVNPKKGK